MEMYSSDSRDSSDNLIPISIPIHLLHKIEISETPELKALTIVDIANHVYNLHQGTGIGIKLLPGYIHSVMRVCLCIHC